MPAPTQNMRYITLNGSYIYYSCALPLSITIVEAYFKTGTTTNSTPSFGFFLTDRHNEYTNAFVSLNSVPPQFMVGNNSGTNASLNIQDFQYNVWIGIQLLISGNKIDVYMGRTKPFKFLGTASNLGYVNPGKPIIVNYLGIFSTYMPVDFKNLRVWIPRNP